MKISTTSFFVGIDVSCETLDIAWRNAQDWVMRKIDNTWGKAQSFAAELSEKHPGCCCIIE
jgi:hypothetical protein